MGRLVVWKSNLTGRLSRDAKSASAQTKEVGKAVQKRLAQERLRLNWIQPNWGIGCRLAIIIPLHW